jgi:hypothetical protein
MTFTFRFDTETHLIRPGLLTPKLVILQCALDRDTDSNLAPIQLLTPNESLKQHTLKFLKSEDVLWEGHNIAYDLGVLCNTWPELTPYVFKMLSEGRGRDTDIRERLIAIRDGHMQEDNEKSFGLAELTPKYCGHVLQKEDTWRLDYALLDGIPVEEWPEEAIRYAKDDVRYLREVSRAQNAYYQPPDEWHQVCAAFALQLCAIWGMRADASKVSEQIVKHSAEKQKMWAILMAQEFINPKTGKVVQKSVKSAIERACAKAGIEVPKTEKGSIKTNKDTCELLKEFDPSLEAISRYNTAGKMLQTYLAPLDFATKYAMTSRPNTLVATGRTSWRGSKLTEYSPYWDKTLKYPKKEVYAGTNLQNFPQMPGIRDCIVPRPGFYFASVDYSSLELRTLGQACLWLVGRSTFAEGYQKDPDWDPHSYFAGELIGIDYQAALKRKVEDKSFKKGPRQVAKGANFSLPGGVGARKLAMMFDKLHKDGELAKQYTVEECFEIKERYLRAYPEMRDYFELAAYHAESGEPITQLVSQRVRGGVRFTSACNTWFQGLAADLGKRALFYVSRACYVEPNSPLYGSRIVAFIHDEILAEVPIEQSSEAAFEIARLMNKAFSEFCPDVPAASEPALMTYWTKKAEFKLNDQGKLIPSH